MQRQDLPVTRRGDLKKEKEHLADSLADIAHQLRTPLTSVNLILSLLEGNPEGDRRRELFMELEDLLVRVDGLITSLLKLSRLDAGIIVTPAPSGHLGRTDKSSP